MKSQTLALAELLNDGAELCRDDALHLLGIQNITARLTNLAAIGFGIQKQVYKCFTNGRMLPICYWRFQHTFKPGDFVQVIKDDHHAFISLLNRVGTVEEVDLTQAEVEVFIPNIGYRVVHWTDLKRVEALPAGTPVMIKPSMPLVVLAFHPEAQSYTLQSPQLEQTIVAHQDLIMAVTEDAPEGE